MTSTSTSRHGMDGPAAALFPALQFKEAAEQVTQLVADQLNLFYVNSTTGDENDIGSYMRKEPLSVFTAGRSREAIKQIELAAVFAGVQPGDCVRIDLAAAPAAVNRAKNMPVAFASGIFEVDKTGRAVNVSGITGISVLSNLFQDVVDPLEEAMLKDMKRDNQQQRVSLQVLNRRECGR